LRVGVGSLARGTSFFEAEKMRERTSPDEVGDVVAVEVVFEEGGEVDGAGGGWFVGVVCRAIFWATSMMMGLYLKKSQCFVVIH